MLRFIGKLPIQKTFVVAKLEWTLKVYKLTTGLIAHEKGGGANHTRPSFWIGFNARETPYIRLSLG